MYKNTRDLSFEINCNLLQLFTTTAQTGQQGQTLRWRVYNDLRMRMSFKTQIYIENPTKSMLWDRPYMSDFLGISGLTPQRCNYCCYQIMLTDPLVYPTPKSTRILTNVSGWVPRKCPDLANHDATPLSSPGPTLKSGPRFLASRRGRVCS